MTTPTTLPFWPDVASEVGPKTQLAVKMIFNSIQNHDSAIVKLKGQLTAAVVPAQTTATVATQAASSPSAPASAATLGGVNNQTGTSYLLATTDNGAIVTLNNAAAVAVTLSNTLATPFVCFVENLGAGLATLTPASGTVNEFAAITLSTGQGCYLVFDGTNWWAVVASGATAFTDIAGVAAVAQIPPLPESKITGLTADLSAKAPIAAPIFTGSTTISAADASTYTFTPVAALPALPGYKGLVITNTGGDGTLQIGDPGISVFTGSTCFFGFGDRTLGFTDGSAGWGMYAVNGGFSVYNMATNSNVITATTDTRVAIENNSYSHYGIGSPIPSHLFVANHDPTTSVAQFVTSASVNALNIADNAAVTLGGVVTQPAPSVLTAAATATSATAGAAAALPATPAGYLEISVNGTVYKLPFFNT